MAVETELSEQAKLLLLVSLLAKDRLISHNGKAFLKELILRRDPLVRKVFAGFGKSPDFLDHVHQLIDRESREMYNSLFVDLSLLEGKHISKTERKRRNLMHDKSLTYGEIAFASFAVILRQVTAVMGSARRGVFYDLGSGTGKAVYVARLTQDFSHCIGIELLEPLYEAAKRITDRYYAVFRQHLDGRQQQDANVYSGSFLDWDWSDGDLVFANSTCFSRSLMFGLAAQAEKLKPGSLVITFTKHLPSRYFEVMDRKRFDMSWGPATVYVQRRMGMDEWAIRNGGRFPNVNGRVGVSRRAGTRRRTRVSSLDIDGPCEEDEQGLANTRAGTSTLPQDLGGIFDMQQFSGAKMVWGDEDGQGGNGGCVNGDDEDDEDEDDGDDADDNADDGGDDGGVRNGNGNGSNNVVGGDLGDLGDPADAGDCGDHGYYRAVDDGGGDSGVPAGGAEDRRENARDAGWLEDLPEEMEVDEMGTRVLPGETAQQPLQEEESGDSGKGVLLDLSMTETQDAPRELSERSSFGEHMEVMMEVGLQQANASLREGPEDVGNSRGELLGNGHEKQQEVGSRQEDPKGLDQDKSFPLHGSSTQVERRPAYSSFNSGGPHFKPGGTPLAEMDFGDMLGTRQNTAPPGMSGMSLAELGTSGRRMGTFGIDKGMDSSSTILDMVKSCTAVQEGDGRGASEPLLQLDVMDDTGGEIGRDARVGLREGKKQEDGLRFSVESFSCDGHEGGGPKDRVREGRGGGKRVTFCTDGVSSVRDDYRGKKGRDVAGCTDRPRASKDTGDKCNPDMGPMHAPPVVVTGLGVVGSTTSVGSVAPIADSFTPSATAVVGPLQSAQRPVAAFVGEKSPRASPILVHDGVFRASSMETGGDHASGRSNGLIEPEGPRASGTEAGVGIGGVKDGCRQGLGNLDLQEGVVSRQHAGALVACAPRYTAEQGCPSGQGVSPTHEEGAFTNPLPSVPPRTQQAQAQAQARSSPSLKAGVAQEATQIGTPGGANEGVSVSTPSQGCTESIDSPLGTALLVRKASRPSCAGQVKEGGELGGYV